jgi:Protein of unknown function (DUF3429)
MNASVQPSHQTTRPLPIAAWLLGAAGLLPFIAAPALALLGQAHYLPMQRLYAACILAFLGALHWGPALNGSAQKPTLLLGWGVVPSLWAWAALQLPPFVQALALIAGLIAAMDLLLAPLHRWARGYLLLRTVLTVVACASLLAGFLLKH